MRRLLTPSTEIIERLDRQDEIAREYREEVLQRLVRIEENSATAASHHIDHEVRIRGMERKQWIVAGAAAVVGGILSKFGFHFPLMG
jgi:hypothetical protein